MKRAIKMIEEGKQLKTPKMTGKKKQFSDATELSKCDGRQSKSFFEEATVEEADPNSIPQETTSCILNATAVNSAALNLLKLEESSSKSNTLFMDEAKPIMLQICCIKIPITPERQLRFCLPHSLITPTTEVCLFVADLKKGRNEDHEPTVQHYKDLFQNNDVSGISQVIPLRQLRVEYDQYELRRRLCCEFDVFLVDAKVSGHIKHLLGKSFIKKRVFPTSVQLDSKNLKKTINTALSKTVMNLHGKGDTFNVTVGHSQQSPLHITENIITVAEGLAKNFPGGWDNIQSLYVKTAKSMSIPLYVTLKSSNLIEVPIVESKRPKAAVPVKGDLSTLLGASVTVYPSGEVVVHKDVEESDWSDLELSDAEEESEQPKKENKKTKNTDDEVDDEEEDEDEMEMAENDYLSGWQKEFDARTTEKVAKRKSEEDLPKPMEKKLKSTDKKRIKGKSAGKEEKVNKQKKVKKHTSNGSKNKTKTKKKIG